MQKISLNFLPPLYLFIVCLFKYRLDWPTLLSLAFIYWVCGIFIVYDIYLAIIVFISLHYSHCLRYCALRILDKIAEKCDYVNSTFVRLFFLKFCIGLSDVKQIRTQNDKSKTIVTNFVCELSELDILHWNWISPQRYRLKMGQNVYIWLVLIDYMGIEMAPNVITNSHWVDRRSHIDVWVYCFDWSTWAILIAPLWMSLSAKAMRRNDLHNMRIIDCT